MDDSNFAAAPAITNFADSYSFLSNFHRHMILVDGREYPTVEHAYQAAKTTNPDERERIRHALTAGEAKKQGRAATLRVDWEFVKDDVMLTLLRLKFADWKMAELLIATGSAQLVEGNYWHDNYWGDCYCQRCKSSVGVNMLGAMLMLVREERRSFGSGWEPSPQALKICTEYLIHRPEQGDWEWTDHCEGLAGGMLAALHDAGIEIVSS